MSEILTPETYRSADAQKHFLSASQWDEFMECAACAKATLDGKWKDEDKSVALAMGTYIDLSLLTPDRLAAWISREENAEWFYARERKSKNNPDPQLDFDKPNATKLLADRMIARAKGDENFMLALEGDKQVLITWEMFGHPWKAMLDSATFNESKGLYCYTDLKSTASVTATKFVKKLARHAPFIEIWNYWLQVGAIYGEAYKAHYGKDPDARLLAAVSKDKFPTLRIFNLGDMDRINTELEGIKNNIEQVIRWKTGQEEPFRCEDCDYCRATYVCPDEPIEAVNMLKRGREY